MSDFRTLGEATDEIIKRWTDADWHAFLSRYMAAQFPNHNPESKRPRASIPAQAGDDDLILSRVIDHARARLNEV